MALTYAEFDTTSGNLVSNLVTHITASTDWATLTGTGLTSAVKATTTRGAQMVVDLADAAANTARLQLGIYRTHDGTTGVDKINRYLTFKNTTGATTDTVHCVVSASKEHLYISVEGPRPGETNADVATAGSQKQSLFIGDIVPYFSGDTVPAVCLIAPTTQAGNPQDPYAHVSRNQANTLSWVVTQLATVTPPTYSSTLPRLVTAKATADSNTYLFPWLVVENTDGLRGRLGQAFLGGMTVSGLSVDVPPSAGTKVSYSSVVHTAQVPHFHRYSSGQISYTPWLYSNFSTQTLQDGVLVMIPSG